MWHSKFINHHWGLTTSRDVVPVYHNILYYFYKLFISVLAHEVIRLVCNYGTIETPKIRYKPGSKSYRRIEGPGPKA